MRRLAMLLCVVVAVFCLAFPLYALYPYRAQTPWELRLALWLLEWRVWVQMACCAGAVWIAFRLRCTRSFVAAAMVVAVTALSQVNVFETIFHPVKALAFEPVSSSRLAANEHVLAVGSRGWPVSSLAYHHIANDWVDGIPVAATYCMLCHSGIVWDRRVDGLTLTFRIGGINDQNLVMRDDQTGSYWQQSTGVAIFGPLAGKQLRVVPADELTVAVFRSEQPGGVVMKDVANDTGHYVKPDWDVVMGNTQPALSFPGQGLKDRDVVIGVSIRGEDWAFPLALLRREKRILHNGILLLVGPDGESVRGFEAPSTSGADWSFKGCNGSGECLKPVTIVQDYWFDWRNRHASTRVFAP